MFKKETARRGVRLGLALLLSAALVTTGAFTVAFGESPAEGSAVDQARAAIGNEAQAADVNKALLDAPAGVNTDFELPVESEPSASGYIATSIDTSAVNDASYTDVRGLAAYAALPATFISPYRTAVKNQDIYGACWSFSSTASAEGSLLRSGAVASGFTGLSPFHLVNSVYNNFMFSPANNNMPPDGSYSYSTDPLAPIMMKGGNDYRATSVLSNWYGARAWNTAWDGKVFPLERDGTGKPKQNTIQPLTATQIKTYDYTLKDTLIFPSPYDSNQNYSQANVNAIKSAVYSYGPLSTSYRSDKMLTVIPTGGAIAYYIDQKVPYYIGNTLINSSKEQDHAVTIIGWDDNYPASRFVQSAGYGSPATTPPPGNGAFLIRNSWGATAIGGGYAIGDPNNPGCFWLSYYEGSISESVYYSMEKPAANTSQYRYDDLLSGGFDLCTYGANKFTVAAGSGTQQINAATVYSYEPGASYTVYMYKNPTYASNPESGRPLDINSGTPLSVTQAFANAGFHTIKFSKPAIVNPGDTFTIVVTGTKPSSSAAFPIGLEIKVEAADGGGNGKMLISSGQSYYVDNSGKWNDLYSYIVANAGPYVAEYGNLNIRGIATKVTLTGLAAAKPTITVVKGASLPLSSTYVNATYSTGVVDSMPLSDKGVSVTGVNTAKVGTYTATVSFGGRTATFQVKVVNKVTRIRTPLTTVYLKKGATYTLPLVSDNGNATVATSYTFKSSNTKVVKVSSKGKLTASKTIKKKTKATVTVTAANGKALKVTVCVVPKASKLKKLTVSGAKATLKKGKYAYLKVKLSPSSATNIKVTYSTSNKKVITVDKAGKVYAKKKGTATVTVKAGSKKYKKKIKVK